MIKDHKIEVAYTLCVVTLKVDVVLEVALGQSVLHVLDVGEYCFT